METDSSWREQANCLGVDPDLFFPERGDTPTTRAAKAVCRECVVRSECLTYAVEMNEQIGIWGGTSGKQRRATNSGKINS